MTEVAENLPFHTMVPEQALEVLETGPSGLDRDVAQARLERYGANELAAGKKISAWSILLRQFANLLIIILLAATVISCFLGEQPGRLRYSGHCAGLRGAGFCSGIPGGGAAACEAAAPVATVVRDGKSGRSRPGSGAGGRAGAAYRRPGGGRRPPAVRDLSEGGRGVLTGESTASGKIWRRWPTRTWPWGTGSAWCSGVR